jgi:hypothetical protein
VRRALTAVFGGAVGKDTVTGPRPAFDQMKVLAGTKKFSFRAEIRDVDHEGIAIPAATRVAVPLTDTGRQVGTLVHHNVAANRGQRKIVNNRANCKIGLAR